jgi:hypothetical protein
MENLKQMKFTCKLQVSLYQISLFFIISDLEATESSTWEKLLIQKTKTNTLRTPT